jgi:catechol 2,3-dioxygenase-like lactoylglutathione lyase family enzyme
VYLSSGCDNLALHEAPDVAHGDAARLDHIGIVVASEAEVERAAAHFADAGIPLAQPVRRHRDGSCSFYVHDPDGTLVQVLYEPTISPLRIGPA